MGKPGDFWKSVPDEHLAQWRSVFHDFPRPSRIKLTAPCPVCGHATLRQYYDVGRPEPRQIGNERFVARGANWQWCASCGSYEHSSCLVPESWCGEVLAAARLTAYPDALEEAVAKLDNSARPA